MEFFIHMDPPTVTHQEKKVTMRGGRPVFYEPAEIKRARQLFLVLLARHRPKTMYTDGVRLTVRWCFPAGRHKPGTYRTTKPDTDNLQKLLKDCMTALRFWRDDALVVDERCVKMWAVDADHTGIYFDIEPVEDHFVDTNKMQNTEEQRCLQKDKSD